MESTPNVLLREARRRRGWTQRKLAEKLNTLIADEGEQGACTPDMIRKWEQGIHPPSSFYASRLSAIFDRSTDQLGISPSIHLISPFLLDGDVISSYNRGIIACRDLYYKGDTFQMETHVPIYSHNTALLAQQPSPMQSEAMRLASQSYQLFCEIATDRENYGLARQAGQHALLYAEQAEDCNLQVAALISLANLGWHLSFSQPAFIKKHSRDALNSYLQAVSLLENNVTPLLKGRTLAGIAEVYAVREEIQESLRAMGQAYEIFPLRPEEDPAYVYMRSSRYSLYVFGDAQSRLLLGQPKEASRALIDMQRETRDPEIEPISRVDLLYYQAQVEAQQNELEKSSSILVEGAELSRKLGSRLYFNKLAARYYDLEEKWPNEKKIKQLEEVFQPW